MRKRLFIDEIRSKQAFVNLVYDYIILIMIVVYMCLFVKFVAWKPLKFTLYLPCNISFKLFNRIDNTFEY